jgi:hypothetical protein
MEVLSTLKKRCGALHELFGIVHSSLKNTVCTQKLLKQEQLQILSSTIKILPQKNVDND